MKKITLFWIIVSLQIGILFSIILRYEYVRLTGFTTYVKAEGYDPTDLFRGDYVDIRYLLPLPNEFIPLVESSNNSILYIVPKIESNRIVGIKDVSKKKPKNGVFLKVKYAFVQRSQVFQIIGEDGSKLPFTNTWCEETEQYKKGGKILYQAFDGRISYISPSLSGSLNSGMKDGQIADLGACQRVLSVSTSQTNRYYVREKSGTDLENKIRRENMYAKWKIGKNGFILLEDIVEEKDIK